MSLNLQALPVVVPVRNEQDNVASLIAEINSALLWRNLKHIKVESR
jgi:hypothetical protein